MDEFMLVMGMGDSEWKKKKTHVFEPADQFIVANVKAAAKAERYDRMVKAPTTDRYASTASITSDLRKLMYEELDDRDSGPEQEHVETDADKAMKMMD